MDWDKIEQLFSIGKSAQEHGPKYAAIASAAQLELEGHLETATKIVKEKAKAAEEEAGRLRAEAANKAREDEEKAHADIQASAEQQAVDRQAKLDADEKAAAESQANVGDAAPVVRRI